MTTTPAPTWWQEHHAFLLECASEPPTAEGSTAEDPPFSADLLALLAVVEEVFAVTGADTPAWEDPHLTADGEIRDSREEEYSRCLDPGKFRILWARAEAWTEVLTARGWAEAEEHDGSSVEWAPSPPVPPHRTTVLRPRRSGAQPLVLARTAADDAAGSTDLTGPEADLPGLVVGLGEPALEVATLPDCGCDACGDGSRSLLEQLDQELLSIVDGSSEAQQTPQGHSLRTSFGSSAGTGADEPGVTRRVSAAPWAEGWTPRPLGRRIDPQDMTWDREMLRDPWPTRLLEAMFGAVPAPLVRRLDRLRAGRSGTLTTTLYARAEPEATAEVTAPLDALERVPDGYRRIHRSAVVTGMDFAQARSALRCGVVHRRAGLQVLASRTPFEEGTEIRLRLGMWPLLLTEPCRVLWVIDEEDRTGFAYGTLPGHPESGIEQFMLTRTASGLVRLHLDAVSRPATRYARLGAPVARLVQAVITRRYLRALSDPASAPG